MPKSCTVEAYDHGCICAMPPLFEGCKSRDNRVQPNPDCPLHGNGKKVADMDDAQEQIARLCAELTNAEKARDEYLRMARLHGDGLVAAQAEIASLRAELAASMTVRAELEHRLTSQSEDKIRALNLQQSEQLALLRAELALEKKANDETIDALDKARAEIVRLREASEPDRRAYRRELMRKRRERLAEERKSDD